MSEISMSEQRKDLVTKPVEKEAQKEEAFLKNDFLREMAVSMLSNAVETTRTLFGQFSIVDKQSGNTGAKVNGIVANENMAMPARTAADEPFFLDIKATTEEIAWLKRIASTKRIEAVKAEINEHGRDPKSAVLEAVKNNRIVGLGESSDTNNGLKTLVEMTAPLLAAAGVTHLAVAVPPMYQKILDRAIEGDPAAFKKMHQISRFSQEHLRMMQSLVKEGVKVVAVDYGNDEIAENTAKIIESDPKAKVLCYLGNHILRETPDDEITAGEQLKERGQQKGYSVSTFRAYYDSDADSEGLHFAKNLTRPVSVETDRTKFLKDIHSEKEAELMAMTVGDHDHAIFFPVFSSVAMAELAHGSKSPKIIPALDDLAEKKRHEAAMNPDRRDKMQAEAASLTQRALDIEKRTYGENSPQLTKRYESIIERTLRTGEDLGQVETFLDANVLLGKNSHWRREVASRYEECREPEKAQKHWQEALAHAKSNEGKFLAYLGLASNSLTQKHQKEEYFKEAISLLDQGCAVSGWAVNGCLVSYAKFLNAAAREDEAATVLALRRKQGNGEFYDPQGGFTHEERSAE